MRLWKKNVIKIVLSGIILCGCTTLAILNQFNHKGIKIQQWNNYYDENNIVFFYDDSLNKKISFLNENANLSEVIGDEKDELNKVLKICKVTAKEVDYDDIADTEQKSGYDILKDKNKDNSKKVSRKDFCIITRDMLTSIGIKSRIGYFRSGNSQFKEKTQYYLLEFWSNKASKWIAVDCVDGGYFMDGNTRLSALEILNTGIRKISYIGNTGQKDYKNKIKKYLDSYTINIDNTLSETKSNTQVCYIKEDDALEIKWCKTYAPPTIFTKSSQLFEKSPFDSSMSKDEKAYIIVDLMDNKDKDKNATINAIIAGFMNGSVMREYYLNIDNSGYKKIEQYKTIELKKGVTDIKLSLDGENEVSSVTINREK